MDVTVSVAGRDAAVEELRSLFTWLAGEEEFRGRVRLVETAPEPGTLGGWPEAVVVALGQGGAVTVLASAVIAWMLCLLVVHAAGVGQARRVARCTSVCIGSSKPPSRVAGCCSRNRRIVASAAARSSGLLTSTHE